MRAIICVVCGKATGSGDRICAGCAVLAAELVQEATSDFLLRRAKNLNLGMDADGVAPGVNDAVASPRSRCGGATPIVSQGSDGCLDVEW